MTTSLIEQGRAALRDGDAAAARRAFEAALAEPPSGEVLDGLAEALYLDREYKAAAHHERAYSAYHREGERMAAGRTARMVAWITGNVFGNWAVQIGWFARALQILEEAGEDGPEHGWVLIISRFRSRTSGPARPCLGKRSRSDGASAIPTSSSRRCPTSAARTSWSTASRRGWSSSTRRWRQPAPAS